MDNKSYKIKLHNRVIHEEKQLAGMRAQYAETEMIKSLNDNELISICKECFSEPR